MCLSRRKVMSSKMEQSIHKILSHFLYDIYPLTAHKEVIHKRVIYKERGNVSYLIDIKGNASCRLTTNSRTKEMCNKQLVSVSTGTTSNLLVVIVIMTCYSSGSNDVLLKLLDQRKKYAHGPYDFPVPLQVSPASVVCNILGT